MSSANKKSPRNFQCRNGLWSTFEEMAAELECSVDYLINDAMKQYARQRGYTNEQSQAGAPLPAASSPTSGAVPPPAPKASQETSGSVARALPVPGPSEGSVAKPLPIPPPTSGSVARPLPPGAFVPGPTSGAIPGFSAPAHSRAAPPPVPGSTLVIPPVTAPSHAELSPAPLHAPGPPPIPGSAGRPLTRAPHLTVPLSPSRLPPMPPSVGASPLATAPPRPPAPNRTQTQPVARALIVHYEGQPFQVNKDRFIIGRGKTSSDLTIRDPNVSRQHALIEFSGGNFYMVDMGSTNGVEFNGHRVHRKAIQNGDVFRVCDHELFCSFN